MAWPPWSKGNEKALAFYVVPAVADRVKLAQGREEVLRRHGRTKLVELIYGALASHGLQYAREKYHYDSNQQLVREPDTILDGSLEGTCLDLALLFAGVCLGKDLVPLIVIVHGHAFVAVSLTHDRERASSPGRFADEGEWVSDGLLKDGETLKRLIDRGDWLAVECTGFAKSIDVLPSSVPEGKGRENGLMSFARACEAGREQLVERRFEFAIDIAVLQEKGNVPYEPLGYKQAPPAVAVPIPAEPKPEPFIERPELTDPLLRRLLELRHTPGSIEVSVLHGMGGIGKTSIAAWLAWQPLVAKRFSHGRLWITLGRQPQQPLTILTDWLQNLGFRESRPLTLEAARTNLATLLQDRAVLFIIDDVWPESGVEQLIVPSPRSQFLLTTRYPEWVRLNNGRQFSVDEMTAEQAEQVLTRALKRSLALDEVPLAQRLAEIVGNHPLALELAAARLKDALPWQRLIAELSADIARLEALEDEEPFVTGPAQARRRRVSVRASLMLSIAYLNDEYQQAFAWLGVLAEHAEITPTVAAKLWSIEENAAGKRLAALAGMHLLSRRGSAYVLHDLLHDVARELLTKPKKREKEGDLTGLGLTLETASGQLVDAYRQKLTEGDWQTLKDDGYALSHIVYHMSKAARIEDLRALVTKRWLEAQERRIGSCESDVELAISAVERTGKGYFIDLFRWCYARSILGSRAMSLPPELLGVMVHLGQTRQAQQYAARIDDSSIRASAYLWMLKAAIARRERDAARKFARETCTALMLIQSAGPAMDLAVVADLGLCAKVLGDSNLCEYAAKTLEAEGLKQEKLLEVPQSMWEVNQLCSAVRGLIALGDRDRATPLIRKTVEMLPRKVDRIGIISALLTLATSLSRLGMPEWAEHVKEQAESAFRAAIQAQPDSNWNIVRFGSAFNLVGALVETGELEIARLIADHWVISDWSKSSYPGALAKIAEGMRAAGRLEGATRLAAETADSVRKLRIAEEEEQIYADEYRKRNLVEIAKLLTRVGSAETAVDIARRIEPARTRAAVLAGISNALIESGDSQKASDIAGEALKTESGSYSDVTEAAAFASLARSLERLGGSMQARNALQQAESLLEAEPTETWKVEQTRLAVAKALALLSDPEEIGRAMRILEPKTGLPASLVHSGPEHALNLQTEVLEVFAREKTSREAMVMINEIVAAARKLDASIEKAGVIARAGRIVSRLGHVERALEYAREAVSVIKELPVIHGTSEQFACIDALGFSAGILAAYACSDEMMQAVSLADHTAAEESKTRVLSQVISELWILGTLDRALETAHLLVELDPSKTMMLAETLERMGNHGQAQKEARKALKYVWTSDSEPGG